uniref:Wbp11/ELF5/Saf1 N-terminal domain-containing protein n=1 Tax=Anas platyrhynchos platyrhynchos TaxID=8840 RepID=U3J524_ANAPP
MDLIVSSYFLFLFFFFFSPPSLGKEARKRELKKNKKQRMMVRAAVLKMKDPKQIIRDMEKLDEMEFNPVQQPQLNEKVLKDKRKKLRETFERILRLYEKENPDIYKELRKLEVEYEQKRSQLSQYFDAVKDSEGTMTICLVPARMKAILRIWIKTSMTRAVMTVTVIGQMQTVKVRTSCIVTMTRREKVEKKRNQV